MHIIVTGGTGYIGRQVVRMAVQQGHRVTVVGTQQPMPGVERTLPWRFGDPVPEATWSEPADAVIHLAHLWHGTGPEADDVNVSGVATLLAAARRAGVKNFLFASSLSARIGHSTGMDASNIGSKLSWTARAKRLLASAWSMVGRGIRFGARLVASVHFRSCP